MSSAYILEKTLGLKILLIIRFILNVICFKGFVMSRVKFSILTEVVFIAW